MTLLTMEDFFPTATDVVDNSDRYDPDYNSDDDNDDDNEDHCKKTQ